MLLFNGYRVSFLGVKRSEREGNLFSSSAEVLNEWSYTFIPHLCFYGVDT